MAPEARSKFVAPMFEPEVFRKQMFCIEESTCDVVGTLRRPSQSFGAPRSDSAPRQSCPPRYAPAYKPTSLSALLISAVKFLPIILLLVNYEIWCQLKLMKLRVQQRNCLICVSITASFWAQRLVWRTLSQVVIASKLCIATAAWMISKFAHLSVLFNCLSSRSCSNIGLKWCSSCKKTKRRVLSEP